MRIFLYLYIDIYYLKTKCKNIINYNTQLVNSDWSTCYSE